MTPDAIADLRRKHYNATLVWQREANSDLRILRVQPDFPVPAHRAGQYCTLGLGNWEPRAPGCQEETLTPADEQKMVRRAYSLSCSILDEHDRLFRFDKQEWLEFYIVLVRDSGRAQPPALTPRLFLLGEGDRLFIGPKIAGHFTAEHVKPDDAVVLLSTGTGEAPHNYIVWDLLSRGHQGPILAACCVRYKRDLGYLAMQEKLMAQYSTYRYLSLTTREAETVKHKVYIQDLLTSGQLEEQLGRALDPARTHVYLCGNPKMIGVPVQDRATGVRSYPQPLGVIEILERRGFQVDQPASKQHGNIHFEEYW